MADIKEDNKLVEEDTQRGKFLAFSLDKEVFGIELSCVMEIIGIQHITRTPQVPDYVKGIINLRGKVIPVLDVRLKFNKAPLDYNDRTCIIVVDINQIQAGLIVDSVNEVLNISDSDIEAPPSMGSGGNNKYIKGIGKSGNQVQLILDCQKLLMPEETDETMENEKRQVQ